MNPGQVITFVIGSLVAIFLAYYATYFIAKRGSKIQSGRTLRVLDRASLSKDKMICVVSVRDKIYIVAMSDGAVTVMDTFDADEYEQAEEQRRRDVAALSNMGQQ